MKKLFLLFSSLALAGSLGATTITYNVTLDTGSLAGVNANVYFNLSAGSLPAAPVTASVRSFTPAPSGSAVVTGAVSGNLLTNNLDIDNTGSPTNDYYQSVVLSNLLNFQLTLDVTPTSPASGSTFGFALFNAAGDTALLSTDSVNGNIATWDIAPTGAVTPTLTSSASISATTGDSVPEPATFGLAAATLISLLLFRRR